MNSYYVPRDHNQILYLAKKNLLSKSDICRIMNVTIVTLNNYINEPGLMRLKDLYLLSGIFGINVLELVYLLSRSTPKLKHKQSKWYLEEIKIKVEKFEEK